MRFRLHPGSASTQIANCLGTCGNYGVVVQTVSAVAAGVGNAFIAIGDAENQQSERGRLDSAAPVPGATSFLDYGFPVGDLGIPAAASRISPFSGVMFARCSPALAADVVIEVMVYRLK
jgi:hypothetical protein